MNSFLLFSMISGVELIILILALLPFLFFRKRKVSTSILSPFEFSPQKIPTQNGIGSFLLRHQISSNYSQVNYFKISFTYGIVLGVLSFIFDQFLLYQAYAFGVYDFYTFSAIASLLLSFTIIFLCLRHFRKNNFGFLNMKIGLAIGAIIGTTNSAISGAINYFYYFIIDPNAFEQLIEIQMSINGYGYEDEYFRESLVEAYSTGFIYTILAGLLLGLIISIIPTLILKTK